MQDTQSTEHYKIQCFTEYNVLKKVILCQPQYMTIRDVINETQKHFKNEGIHIEKALKQHDEFVNTYAGMG
jgi:N-dimethylarginine dimethylaminohydrolase